MKRVRGLLQPKRKNEDWTYRKLLSLIDRADDFRINSHSQGFTETISIDYLLQHTSSVDRERFIDVSMVFAEELEKQGSETFVGWEKLSEEETYMRKDVHVNVMCLMVSPESRSSKIVSLAEETNGGDIINSQMGWVTGEEMVIGMLERLITLEKLNEWKSLFNLVDARTYETPETKTVGSPISTTQSLRRRRSKARPSKSLQEQLPPPMKPIEICKDSSHSSVVDPERSHNTTQNLRFSTPPDSPTLGPSDIGCDMSVTENKVIPQNPRHIQASLPPTPPSDFTWFRLEE